ncbi:MULTISPECIES: sugar transferase [Bacillus]|uniref:UDP-phosphate N-acetylgalactosaminyl-1-phosphate transferase n=2 Tax=Bacillus TaxID=1386 RepID=A0A0M4FKW7_9BACI|nr:MULTISPECIES: exopolysaccharide biosynthesis polyprenyl glycosylphosphotransferase [Bacillus]ALC82517.1 UDP-phosphate N-acetylgalactosaminyl-1-phosphate transferase [Bacillus gobiensis]MBP1081419.1 exopolysaccharide biosynthesis polyprenyl glycosylphosphotransferase [Bacillus capparidis]MED1096091.1 exopolysaccharide biosynthesis polyprenyl glycosylphosphotransferase [Bacillus capparidis]
MNAEKSMNLYRQYRVRQDRSRPLSVKAQKYLIVKRMLDIAFSIIGLVFAFPVILFFAMLISIETPGSPFYIQERVGMNGKYFKVIKLRSMRKDAEKSGAKWAEANDPRITRIGSFIRKTRIDELPQLLNVLLGDMSIVGPRPERPCFTAEFNNQIPGFTNRLIVKPGLTGWAQVNGGYEISPKEKLIFDLYYINHLTFLMDIKIMLKTFKVVLTGDGAR